MANFKLRLRTAEPLENGKFPILLQIVWRNQKNHVRRKRLGISCTKEEWNREDYCLKNTAWGYVKKNALLKEAKAKAERIFMEMPEWNYNEWSKRFSEKEEVYTFDKWANELVEEYNNRGQAGSADHYKDAKRALQKFMGKDKIYFEENY